MSRRARVHVAVGVVIDGEGRILVAQRPLHLHQGGLWEFPGGKVEAGELVTDALRRELDEELAIDVLDAEPLLEVEHDYGDKSVLLDVWKVTAFRGEPQGREGQPWRWVERAQLQSLAFPAANVPIIEALIDAPG
jgi:8-oxo-dGTP diphosphatase